MNTQQSPNRAFLVHLRGYEGASRVVARSRAAARYRSWLSFSDVMEGSFLWFCQNTRVVAVRGEA